MQIIARDPLGWESRPCLGTGDVLWFGPPEGDWAEKASEPADARRRREVEGKRICAGCSFVGFCLSSELERPITHQWGTRGGMTQEERRELIRLRMRAAIGARRRIEGTARSEQPKARRGLVRFPSAIDVSVEATKAVA